MKIIQSEKLQKPNCINITGSPGRGRGRTGFVTARKTLHKTISKMDE
jgi:hypothetical protein